MSPAPFVVVGAGIAGLSCATELERRGADVLLLEAGERVGGPVETVTRTGFLIERGPSTVRGSEALRDLASHAGIELVTGERRPPMLVSNGALLRLPPSPLDLARGRPIPLGAWLDLAREPFRNTARTRSRAPQTVANALVARLGPGLADRFADLLTLGVYGAPAGEVGFEAAFPELAAELAEVGSFARVLGRRWLVTPEPREGLISTRAGLQPLVEGLGARLGARLRPGIRVRALRRTEDGFELETDSTASPRIEALHVVLAVPPFALPEFPGHPRVGRLASRYRTRPQTLASFAVRETRGRAFESFGVLVPTRERLPLLGCLIPSAIFPDRAPAGAGLLTVFVGPELVGKPDAEIRDTLAPLLRRLFGLARQPELLDVAHHPHGIVLYDRRHPARTTALRRSLEAAGGPLLAGWGYDGVAFGAAAESGLRAAHRLAP